MNSDVNNILVLLQQASASVSNKVTKKIFFKNICLLLCITVINSVQARHADTTAFTTAGAFFALSVADIEASSKWYSEKLGLRVTMHLPRQEKTAVTILEGGGLIVELIQNDDAQPLSAAAPSVKDNIYIHGFFKAGVIVEDFDKTIAILKQRGVEVAYGPFPAKTNQRVNVIIKDNSGNLIQFFGK